MNGILIHKIVKGGGRSSEEEKPSIRIASLSFALMSSVPRMAPPRL